MSLNTGRWITFRGNIGRKLNKGVTLLKKENMQVRAAVDEYTDFWNRAIVTQLKEYKMSQAEKSAPHFCGAGAGVISSRS